MGLNYVSIPKLQRLLQRLITYPFLNFNGYFNGYTVEV